MTIPRLALMGCFLLAASSSGCAVAERAMNDALDPGMVTTTAASWETNAQDQRGLTGTFAYDCPPNPSQQNTRAVFGSGPYTDDSSVCMAGVHAGTITFRQGGRVVIEPRPGQNRYAGSERNGVASRDWGRYDGSFAVR